LIFSDHLCVAVAFLPTNTNAGSCLFSQAGVWGRGYDSCYSWPSLNQRKQLWHQSTDQNRQSHFLIFEGVPFPKYIYPVLEELVIFARQIRSFPMLADFSF
tara:strand:+ start:25948 stop:26250 length:303 start_codon:yes stop_codon:yes gene_type:complete